MADDIFGNMSNMSIDELGSSLLQRKAEQEREAAKKAKKNERIQQGLALLLMGQGIMKTQYKKRMKELEDFHKFETLNNEHKVKQLNMNATILNTIGNTWDGKGGLDGFKNSDDYMRFSKEVRPFVDQKIKAMTADEYDTIYGTSTYENAMNLATESYANKYLETDTKSGKANYLAYQDGLRELLGDEAIDLDKNELFQRAMGLSVDELTGYQRKNYQNVLAQYKAQGNLMGGFKRVLGLFNDDFKAKGGFDIFSKVTEDALAGPTIRDLNQAMNLKGMTNNIVSKALADASKSDTRWRERARGKRFENYRKNIGELYLPQMTNLIEEGRYPSELETDTFIGKGNWEEFMSDISAGDKENLILDTAALSLRLKEDRRFLESVYNETEGKKTDGRSFNEFRAILDDEANRSMFAAMIVTDAGFRDESWSPFNWKNETYDSFGTLTKIYNRYNVSTMIGDDIKVNERGSVSLPESYIEASKERKQDMLKSTVKDILATSKTENERNIKLGGELDSEINKYFGMDSQAFIEMLAREEMKIPETNEESLEAEIQRRIGKLPEQTPAGAFISGDSREKRIIMEETSKFDKEKRQDFLTKKNTLIDEIRNINKEKTLPVTRNLFTLPSEKEDKEIQDENARYVTDLIKEKYGINTNTNNLQKISIDITNALEDNPEVFNEIMDIIQNKDNIEYLKSLKDEKKKNLETNKIITSPINDDVIELQNKHLTQKKKDGTPRFTYNNIEEAQEKLNDLSSVLLYIESDGNFDAANPNKEGVVDEQSARGGYQFKPDSIDPAIVRLERVMGPMPRFDIVKKTKDARDLSPEDQTLLVMADILEKTAVVNKEKRPGYGDTLIQNYLDAETAKEKRDAVYEIYKILHHTGDTLPFKAKINTTRKLRKYFNE
jgi:hypothetical protein